MGFNVILLLFVNHLKDFCDLQTAWRLVLHPWNHGRTNDLSFDFFNNDIYIYEIDPESIVEAT